MDYFAGLDVSVKETSVCIVDDAGKIVREARVASEPEALLQVLTNPAYRFKRIGLEAGPLLQWLFSALAEAGLPVICVETRHMKAALSAQINKSDRNDARGIAQMMRVGLYRPVHLKTIASQKRRMLLTSRQLLQAKALDIENDLRGTLRNFGLKVGMVGTVKFEARIRELVTIAEGFRVEVGNLALQDLGGEREHVGRERQLRQVGEIVLGLAHLIGVAQRGAEQPLAIGLKRDHPLALGQDQAPERDHGLA